MPNNDDTNLVMTRNLDITGEKTCFDIMTEFVINDKAGKNKDARFKNYIRFNVVPAKLGGQANSPHSGASGGGKTWLGKSLNVVSNLITTIGDKAEALEDILNLPESGAQALTELDDSALSQATYDMQIEEINILIGLLTNELNIAKKELTNKPQPPRDAELNKLITKLTNDIKALNERKVLLDNKRKTIGRYNGKTLEQKFTDICGGNETKGKELYKLFKEKKDAQKNLFKKFEEFKNKANDNSSTSTALTQTFEDYAQAEFRAYKDKCKAIDTFMSDPNNGVISSNATGTAITQQELSKMHDNFMDTTPKGMSAAIAGLLSILNNTVLGKKGTKGLISFMKVRNYYLKDNPKVPATIIFPDYMDPRTGKGKVYYRSFNRTNLAFVILVSTNRGATEESNKVHIEIKYFIRRYAIQNGIEVSVLQPGTIATKNFITVQDKNLSSVDEFIQNALSKGPTDTIDPQEMTKIQNMLTVDNTGALAGLMKEFKNVVKLNNTWE